MLQDGRIRDGFLFSWFVVVNQFFKRTAKIGIKSVFPKLFYEFESCVHLIVLVEQVVDGLERALVVDRADRFDEFHHGRHVELHLHVIALHSHVALHVDQVLDLHVDDGLVGVEGPGAVEGLGSIFHIHGAVGVEGEAEEALGNTDLGQVLVEFLFDGSGSGGAGQVGEGVGAGLESNGATRVVPGACDFVGGQARLAGDQVGDAGDQVAASVVAGTGETAEDGTQGVLGGCRNCHAQDGGDDKDSFHFVV